MRRNRHDIGYGEGCAEASRKTDRSFKRRMSAGRGVDVDENALERCHGLAPRCDAPEHRRTAGDASRPAYSIQLRAGRRTTCRRCRGERPSRARLGIASPCANGGHARHHGRPPGKDLDELLPDAVHVAMVLSPFAALPAVGWLASRRGGRRTCPR